jgi:hypothetical protein
MERSQEIARGSAGPRLAAPVRSHLAGLLQFSLSRWGIAFAAAGVAGMALRIWAYGAAVGMPDSDEAVVGLMARHVLHGEFTTFYWGAPYGGTQEVLLIAPLFAIAGSSLLALRVLPFVLSAVATLLIWRVGIRTIGGRAGAVAAAIFWIWPPFNFQYLTHEYAFYSSNIVYCALILLLAVRVVEDPSPIRVGLLGLVLGLAFWQTAQIVPIAVPVVVWTIWREPRSLRHLWAAVPLAVLGALPWLIWNARHGWESLMPHSGLDTYRDGLRLIASPLLPMTLGLRAPLTMQLLLPKAVTYVIYAGLLGLFVSAAVKLRGRNASLLYATAAAFPFVWAISRRATALTSEPRFLIVLTPVLALLLAHGVTRFGRATVVVTLALLCTTTIVNLHRADLWRRADGQHWPPTVPRDFGPLISTLDSLGLDHVYAEYWIAYRLDFDTRERIVAAQNDMSGVRFEHGEATPTPDPDRNVRYRPYEREVLGAARHGFVFFRETARSSRVAARLEQHGWRRHPVGTFVVYAPPT